MNQILWEQMNLNTKGSAGKYQIANEETQLEINQNISKKIIKWKYYSNIFLIKKINRFEKKISLNWMIFYSFLKPVLIGNVTYISFLTNLRKKNSIKCITLFYYLAFLVI